MNQVTQEEKIDYIYNTLKKNEKKALYGTVFKWLFRIFILVYIYYFITSWLPNMIKNFAPTLPNFLWSESSEVDVSNIDTNTLKNALENYLKD